MVHLRTDKIFSFELLFCHTYEHQGFQKPVRPISTMSLGKHGKSYVPS